MTDKTSRPRRMARARQASNDIAARQPSKLDQLAALLMRPQGASIAELTAATGWQQHSVRGAMAGSLARRGLVISSDKSNGVRRYRATAA